MQTCSQCNTQSPDTATICPHCEADLTTLNKRALALKGFQENPRVVNIRLIVAEDCCPACREFEGTYPKDEVPRLPVEGCSHKNGCRCFYEPRLEVVYP